jgi:hypothetical protein
MSRARFALLLTAVAVVVSGCVTEQGSVGAGPAVAGHSVVAAPGISAEARPARAAKPVHTPCTANHRTKYVLVSLRRQRMWMCARAGVARVTGITSGAVGVYTSTPTGLFQVQDRVRDTSLTLIDGSTYPVKYWIPFQGPLFGFHDSPWQRFPYGSPEYRTQGSHGCIHVPLSAIRFLYRWASVGTPVRIRA